MANRIAGPVVDLRQHKRIKQNKKISWSIADKSGINGVGRIVNLSEAGLLLETNSDFIPQDGQTFNFNNSSKEFDFLPSQAKIVWSKKKENTFGRFVCGAEFTNSTEHVRSRLNNYVNSRIKGLALQERWGKPLSIVLTLAIACLTVFSLWMSSEIYENLHQSTQTFINVSQKQAVLATTYQGLYKETRQKLIAAEQELETTKELLRVVTQDLEATKAILAETEGMLGQVRGSNSSLKNEISSLEGEADRQIQILRAELESKIADLEAQNTALKAEMAGLHDEIRYYEGNVKDVEEGRLFLSTYKDRVKLVKEKIKIFRSEAEQVRRKASRDRDRLLLELGNNGYFMKNGQSVKVDTQKYNAVSQSNPEGIVPSARSIDVNVQIVE